MKKIISVAMAAILAMALSACGSKNDGAAASSTPSPEAAANAKVVTMAATNFQFDQTEYRLSKGETVTFELDNKQGMHGMQIKDLGVNLSGGKKSQTVTLDKAGTYVINCSVPCGSGHTNMKAKLIVE